ncbi:MAG: AAA family ATPase [Pirellulaceae bacterium]
MEIVPNILDEAKYYASALGWRVIPCHAPMGSGCSCGRSDCKKPGKHPRLTSWQTKATVDVSQIESWWKQWPESNLGVVLGPSSQVIDIEYDDDEGEATAQELLAHLKTPKYRSHRSTHHLFYFPERLYPPKAVLRWRGLEIRFGTDARGAQSIFPPSLHASGQRYEWLLHPSKVGLADAPLWLADAISEAAVIPAKVEAHGVANALSFIMRGESETLETHPGESQGNRHSKLMELVGRWLGTHGPSGELPQLALNWAVRCTPPMEPNEVLGVVARLAEKELSKGVKQGGGGSAVQLVTTAQATPRTFQARPYSDIDATEVEWLWKDRIAIGKLTLLVGEPGLGKTFAAIDIAAHVSTGSPFADGATPPMGEVAILTAEDGAGDTIRPRLDAAGADVSKVLHIDGVGSGDTTGFPSLKDDLQPLEEFFKSRPELRLIIVDPLAAFLGDKIDSHSNTQVRAVLGPLCELCERYRVALLGITHLAKAEAKAINRVIGSIAFVAAARACWLVAKDRDDETTRLFLPVKNNLSQSNGLAYAIVDGRCCWHSEEVLVSADDIGGDENETPREEARQWLLAKLTHPMPAKWILTQAKADGISERTLHRAKKELGIVSEKSADAWVWRLPEQTIEPAEEGVFVVQ